MKDGLQHIAVIGSGVAGLTASHLLQREHQVTLFEVNDRLGGHTNTVILPDGPDAGTPVDTGFIVMNHRNYPLLTELFSQLGVELRDSNMSFGYHDLVSGLQYCGNGMDGLFAQRRNLFRPSFYRMVRDTLKFFRIAQKDCESDLGSEESLKAYLDRNGFGQEFVDHHIVPMGSAIWSTPCEEILKFPARSFLRFFKNHGLLTLNDRPQWKTVVGGSSTYIRQMQEAWTQVVVRLNSKIEGVTRMGDGVELTMEGGTVERFDQIVIATHADQALNLLNDPSPRETETLGVWEYSQSRTVLHTDASVMPPIRRVWSSWNFHRSEGLQTSLTYYMNLLQGLRTHDDYFVSLDPFEEPEGIVCEFMYTHPMFTRESVSRQSDLPALNGQQHTWFAGSYFGNGFHEDAVRSAVHLASQFGIEL